MSAQQSHMEQTPVSGAKVAIPRQKPRASPSHGRRRVRKACETCRNRKIKCSGDTPFCRQCKDLEVTCLYPLSWRERMRGDISGVISKASEYESLLKDISAYADGKTKGRILSALEKYNMRRESQTASQYDRMEEQSRESDGDGKSSSSSAGSLDAIDRVEEDLNRTPSSRATGYMGKGSEVTWMQSVQKQAENRSRPAPPSETELADQHSLHSMSYHMDSLDISSPGPVQAYAMPPKPVADGLFEEYLNTVHPFFPIINRQLFKSQYQIFYGGSARPGDKWLAILNLIFAIGAKHTQISGAFMQGDKSSHAVYLTRARILSMNGDVLFSHPDLQQIQVEGLIAFYLLACEQLNRAWRIAALAVRSAITLGLNLKSTSNTTTTASKDARYRVWWCLYTLEHMLGIMTGRVTYISEGVCKTPFPLPIDEERLSDPIVGKLLTDEDVHRELIESELASAHISHMPLVSRSSQKSHSGKAPGDSWLKNQPLSSALCFLYYTDLTVIFQGIVNQVYSLESCTASWAFIEDKMRRLGSRVDAWKSNLPDAYNFTNFQRPTLEILRANLLLGFHYYSCRITLGRPCLCRHDSRPTSAEKKSTSFSSEMAIVTIESAHLMLDMLPDIPEPLWLYQTCPWWCILHYLMQAETILLLELSFGCVHMPNERNKILQYNKKAVLWLGAMSNYSLASRRAWELCDQNLRQIANDMDYDVSNMPTTITEPVSLVQPGNDVPATSPTKSLPFSLAQQSQQPTTTRQSKLSIPLRRNSLRDQDIAMVDEAVFPDVSPEPTVSELGFPFDPISGELASSLFPVMREDSPWDEM